MSEASSLVLERYGPAIRIICGRFVELGMFLRYLKHSAQSTSAFGEIGQKYFGEGKTVETSALWQ